VYEKCKANFASKLKFKSNPKTANNEMAKAFEGAFEQMFKGMATGLCEELRKECEQAPDGEKCRALMRAMK
jgi:hypothetical protein